MSKQLLKSIAIMGLIFNTLPLNASDNSNGFYMGVDTAFINIGDDTLDITTYDSDGNKKSKKRYKDVTSISYGLKVGYQHFDKNRIELSVKDNKISTDEGNIKGATIGINYEWGFTSLETGHILPYLSIGFDGGRAELSKFKFKDKKVDMASSSLGIGIRYDVNENFDAKIGYLHKDTGFGDFENEKGDIQGISQDKLEFGVSYKF